MSRGEIRVVIIALPFDRLAVPITAVPMKNVTVPVGMVVPVDAFTLAVRVSAELTVALSAEGESDVVVPTAAD